MAMRMIDLRAAAGALSSDIADVGWLTTRQAALGYLGWLRRQNVGDEQMFYSLKSELRNGSVRVVPLTRVGRVFTAKSRVKVLVLGGGTLIGRPEWNVRLSEAIRRLRPETLVSVGTGVVLPGSEIDRDAADSALEESAKILRCFDKVTVRGPISAETLGKYGVEAKPIGDLALIDPYSNRGRSSPVSRGVDRLVLVNLVKAGTPGAPVSMSVLSVLQSALDELERTGFRVMFFCMEPGDEDLALTRFGERFEVVPYESSGEYLSQLVASASLVISERLHGSIMAARSGTPFLSLAYMAKVRDFAESIGAEDRVLSDFDLGSASDLVSRCLSVLADNHRQEELDAQIGQRVRDLKQLISSIDRR